MLPWMKRAGMLVVRNPFLMPAMFLLLAAACRADDFPSPPLPIQPPAMPTEKEPISEVPIPVPMDRGARVIEIVPPVMPEIPLGRLLREEVLKNLPRDFVINRNDNWGHQAHVKSIRGLRVVEVLRNHGNWEKMTLKSLDLRRILQLRVDEMSFPARDRVAFTVRLDVPADMEFTKQTWQNGLQIYVGHSRARVRFRTEAVLETGLKLDENGNVLPQEVTGFKIVSAGTCCHEFATENVNGLGGDLAAMSGGNTLHSFKRWQSSLEREVNDKMLAAFVKTAGSPEVIAGYDRLMKSITSQDGLRTLLSARSPLRMAPAPVPVVYEESRPGGAILVPVVVILDGLLNGVSFGSGHHSGGSSGHSGGSSGSSHSGHEEHHHHDR